MEREKSVDESWKDSVAKDKEKSQPSAPPGASQPEPQGSEPPAKDEHGQTEVDVEGALNFINYMSGLVYQAMIFLGEVPNPMADNQTTKDLDQAKLIIDTLIMLRAKTRGNLNKEEENLLNGALYELQMKYVEQTSAGSENNE